MVTQSAFFALFHFSAVVSILMVTFLGFDKRHEIATNNIQMELESKAKSLIKEFIEDIFSSEFFLKATFKEKETSKEKIFFDTAQKEANSCGNLIIYFNFKCSAKVYSNFMHNGFQLTYFQKLWGLFKSIFRCPCYKLILDRKFIFHGFLLLMMFISCFVFLTLAYSEIFSSFDFIKRNKYVMVSIFCLLSSLFIWTLFVSWCYKMFNDIEGLCEKCHGDILKYYTRKNERLDDAIMDEFLKS
jgi:hypothetical protein